MEFQIEYRIKGWTKINKGCVTENILITMINNKKYIIEKITMISRSD